jgi:hypothetical protein
MSFPGQKSDDIFGDLGILMNHWSEFSGQYGMLTLEDAIPSSLLDDLRSEAFQIKTIIAGLNVEDARPLATDAYIEDKYSLLNVVWTDVENTVSLIHLNNRIKLEAVAEKKISCPDCDASVSPDMSYCSSCGTEIPDWSNCIDCGENVDVSDDFCGNCGAELPEGGDLVNSKLETLIQEYEELVEDLNEQQFWIDRVMMRDVAHTAHIDEDSNTERVDWRYCPECGFRHSVYKPKGGRTSECILCEATWQESGINSNKWEMVSGEQQGEMKSGSDWEKMGQEKNKSKEFEQYSDFDTIRVAQRFGG